MISNKAKNIRIERGMTISELARRTGLSRVTITNVENSLVIPSLDTAFLIAKEIGKDINEIFFVYNVNHELQGVKS